MTFFTVNIDTIYSFGIGTVIRLKRVVISNMSFLGLSQLFDESINFEPHKKPLCIDLVITYYSNLGYTFGTHPSLIHSATIIQFNHSLQRKC